MEVYRLSRAQFAKPLSGKGAALKGGRWNPIGVELIYTAVNRSLAMAEVAVHFTLATLPDDYMMITIFLPDDISLQKITPAQLPENWNAFPHLLATQAVGDGFVAANEYCVLQVPSAVTPGDYNLLLNPRHPHFKSIKIVTVEKFPFDKRIFK